MTIDPRLHRIVAAQPYPLLFATISGAHLYGFPSLHSDFVMWIDDLALGRERIGPRETDAPAPRQ
jgi:hypothetical protein